MLTQNAGPPSIWGNTREKWQEINATFAYLLRRHGARFNPAIDLARTIQKDLKRLFPVLNLLCHQTCLFCPDPCCLVATVWFDFKDLLFLHLADAKPPPAQLISNDKQHCRYAGPKGCRLSRLIRPWACTLYLCPGQKAILGRESANQITLFENRIARIKANRLAMEASFLAVVGP